MFSSFGLCTEEIIMVPKPFIMQPSGFGHLLFKSCPSLVSPKSIASKITYRVLLVGPWPWAPHQRTNTFRNYKIFIGVSRGTLHPPSLKITPSSVFYHFLWPTFLLLLHHLFFFSSLRSEPWRSFDTFQVPIIQDLQFSATNSGLTQFFFSALK